MNEDPRFAAMSEGEWRSFQARQLIAQCDDLRALRARGHETSNQIMGAEGLFGRLQKATALLEAVGRQVGIASRKGNPTVVQLFYAPTGLVELGYGMLMVMIGLALLAPTDTFGSGLSFRVMASLLPEVAWGGALLATGLLSIGALFVGSKSLRRLGAFVAAILYGVMAVGFFLSNPIGIAYLQTALPLAGAAWVLIWGARP